MWGTLGSERWEDVEVCLREGKFFSVCHVRLKCVLVES